MKGLLLKDLYQLTKYLRAWVVIIVGFLAASAFTGDSFSFFLLYPMLLSGMTPAILLIYDDQNKWTAWADTLPYTRAQVVSAKYLLTFILVAVLLAVSAVTLTLNPEASSSGVLLHLRLLVAIGLLSPSFILPLMFKLGADKGRLFYYIFLGAFCALSVILFSATSVTLDIGPLLQLAPAVSLLVFLGSWLLSIHLYRSREL